MGNEPDGVVRNLKTPQGEVTGAREQERRRRAVAIARTPWQPAQRACRPPAPDGRRSSLRGMLMRTATTCGSKTSRHAPRLVPSFCTYLTSPTTSADGMTRVIALSAGGWSLNPVRSMTGVPVPRPLAAGRRRHEGQSGRVREELDRRVGLHREIRGERGSGRQGEATALRLLHRNPHLRVEPLEARHQRIGHDEARVPVMGVVPVVAVLEPDPRQVRPDAPGREQVREVEGVLAGLGHRAPSEIFARHRANVLAVAVPAALADVDGPPPRARDRRSPRRRSGPT